MRPPDDPVVAVKTLQVTDAAGAVVAPQWLARAETVHRQLRPDLPADYAGKMQRVFAGGGRMLLAIEEPDRVLGAAVWRVYENTHLGRQLYVDDLVSDEASRSRGVGKRLLDECARVARDLRCVAVTLDSGVHRARAHRFYFREGMSVTSFHFQRKLEPQ